ncbi:zinc-ribbon domain-containing protein [Archaeoglobus sp.]
MYCSTCGNEVDKDYNICPNCGNPIKNILMILMS